MHNTLHMALCCSYCVVDLESRVKNYLPSCINYFFEMKGDVGMSGANYEKGREQRLQLLQTHHTPSLYLSLALHTHGCT